MAPIRYGDYQRSFLMGTTLKRGFGDNHGRRHHHRFQKEVQAVSPLSRVGVDLNEKSAALSDGMRYDLSGVARLHTEQGVRRRGFYSSHSLDRRLKQKFAGSSRESERVKQALLRRRRRLWSRRGLRTNPSPSRG